MKSTYLLFTVLFTMLACKQAAVQPIAEQAAVPQSKPQVISVDSVENASNDTAVITNELNSKTQTVSPLRQSYADCVNASGGETPNIQDCISTEHDFQDARLNIAYQKLKSELSLAEQKSLTIQQRKWISDRDDECIDDLGGDGQAQRLGINECLATATAKRAIELENRQ